MSPYRQPGKITPTRNPRSVFGAGLLMLAIAVPVGAATSSTTGCGAAAVVPTVVSQFPQFEQLYQCVSSNWGKPVDQIVGACGQQFANVIADIIADIEITAGLIGTPKDPYAAEPRVQTLVAAKLAAAKK